MTRKEKIPRTVSFQLALFCLFQNFLKGADWHAQEHEVRRKKLEEMRQALGTDRSGCSTMSHDSSVENDSPNLSADIPDIFALSTPCPVTTPKSHTIEKMENNGTPNTSYRQHAKKRSGSWGDLPKNSSDLKVTNTAPAEPLVAADTSTPGNNIKCSRDGRMSASRGSDVSLKSINQENKLSDLDLNMDK